MQFIRNLLLSFHGLQHCLVTIRCKVNFAVILVSQANFTVGFVRFIAGALLAMQIIIGILLKALTMMTTTTPLGVI